MVEVSRAITKHHYLVQHARDIARIVKEAFHLASTGRPGPVLIDIPKDVQNTVVPDPDYEVAMDLPGYRLPPPPIAGAGSARCSRRSRPANGRSSTAAAASSPRARPRSCASSPPRRASPSP